KAIRGIWRSVGLLKKKRRKHKTKNDLRAVRALWKLFEQTCVDTNDLIDLKACLLIMLEKRTDRVSNTSRKFLLTSVIFKLL
ncbi:MAG: hypothetical protein FD151_1175, partial [bacterium]